MCHIAIARHGMGGSMTCAAEAIKASVVVTQAQAVAGSQPTSQSGVAQQSPVGPQPQPACTACTELYCTAHCTAFYCTGKVESGAAPPRAAHQLGRHDNICGP